MKTVLLATAALLAIGADKKENFWWKFPGYGSATGSQLKGKILDVANHVGGIQGHWSIYMTESGAGSIHELTHGANATANNAIDRPGTNAMYCLNNWVAVLKEPNFNRKIVSRYIPHSLRGNKFDLYVNSGPERPGGPLYLYNEWIAYTNGAIYSIDLSEQAGCYNDCEEVDWVMAPIELGVYCIATLRATGDHDKDYTYVKIHGEDLRDFTRWNLERTFNAYKDARRNHPHLGGSYPQDYHRKLLMNPDAEDLRRFIKLLFGEEWAIEVMEIK